MRRILVLIGLLLVSIFGSAAQGVQIPRDYAVISPSITFSPDNEQFNVQFTVRNAGTSATTDTTIRIINLLDNSVMSEDVLPSIPNGGSVTVNIPFNTRNYLNIPQLPIEIQVGLDDLEPQDSPIAGNNISQISITIPELPAVAAGGTNTVIDGVTLPEGGVTLGDTFVPYETLLGGAIAFVVGLLILWVLSIILRALFRRKPEFSNWQPSYAQMPMLDPNSKEGRRHAWQTHAQNGLILAAPMPNNLHAVKLLMGTDGEPLSNWKITGIRISQYDNYGRVSRSQLIANGRWTNNLNKLMKRRTKLKPEVLEKQVQGMARKLIGQFKRNINAKSAFLPVALDLRFEGKHGEVRIVFELYQAQSNMWVRLDQWEPAMSVNTPVIQESYTFTIHGMSGAEKLPDYIKRLTDDTAWLLNELLRVRAPQAKQPEPQAFNVPDTLSDMKPVSA
jgi:hypothetical protein